LKSVDVVCKLPLISRQNSMTNCVYRIGQYDIQRLPKSVGTRLGAWNHEKNFYLNIKTKKMLVIKEEELPSNAKYIYIYIYICMEEQEWIFGVIRQLSWI